MDIEVKKPSEGEKADLEKEPIWTCEVKDFPWHYDDRETCLILDGEVTVKTADAEVKFGAGDLVTFPKGLDCEWNVTKPVRKHYRFG